MIGIRRSVGVLHDPGAVVELRALDVPWRGSLVTVSGYYDDHDALAAAAADLDKTGAKGVYITLNTVNPAILSRACNRLRYGQEAQPTTSDADILRRRWLLLDFDPERPGGIASTSDEWEATYRQAQACRSWLRERGWPEPVVASSGKGCHLLYRIDLPADDGGLVQRVLQAVDLHFSSEKVKIDTSVYNPARIVRLYGCTNRRGDSTMDRPHRRAELVDVPGPVEVVPLKKLEALAATLPTPQDRLAPRGAAEAFDLEAWVRTHLPDAIGPLPWGKDGRKWVLPVCPWDAAHTDRSAYVVQHGDCPSWRGI